MNLKQGAYHDFSDLVSSAMEATDNIIELRKKRGKSSSKRKSEIKDKRNEEIFKIIDKMSNKESHKSKRERKVTKQEIEVLLEKLQNSQSSSPEKCIQIMQEIKDATESTINNNESCQEKQNEVKLTNM